MRTFAKTRKIYLSLTLHHFIKTNRYYTIRESHKTRLPKKMDILANINMAEKGKEAKLPPPCFSSPPQ